MFKNDFDVFRDKIFDKCRAITKSKGEDYTKGSANALQNFNEAESLGLTPPQACAYLMKKHIDAIYNNVRTGGQSESEPIEERIADAINYLTFLAACIKERDDAKEIKTNN